MRRTTLFYEVKARSASVSKRDPLLHLAALPLLAVLVIPIIAWAQAVLCGPSRVVTLSRSQAAPRSTVLIFSVAMNWDGVLNRPGSCLVCTAIDCIRSLKIRTKRPSHRTQTCRARYSGGTA